MGLRPGRRQWMARAWLPYFVTMLVAGTLAIDDCATVSEVTLSAGQSYRHPAGIKHDLK